MYVYLYACTAGTPKLSDTGGYSAMLQEWKAVLNLHMHSHILAIMYS